MGYMVQTNKTLFLSASVKGDLQPFNPTSYSLQRGERSSRKQQVETCFPLRPHLAQGKCKGDLCHLFGEGNLHHIGFAHTMGLETMGAGTTERRVSANPAAPALQSLLFRALPPFPIGFEQLKFPRSHTFPKRRLFSSRAAEFPS